MTRQTGVAGWLKRLLAVTSAAVIAMLGVPAPAQALPAAAWWYDELQLPKVWTLQKAAGVTVAVVDSGVKATLGDLRGQVLPGYDVTGTHPDGRYDVPTTENPLYGHGSDMASIIAGTGRGVGFVGVAPQAKILPVAFGETLDSISIPKGLRWAVEHGAQVVNISAGTPEDCSPAMQDAVLEAVRRDVIVVAATGNDPQQPVSSPANCVGVIAVGAQADSSRFAAWSGESSGPQLDFVAPGENLPGVFLNDTYAPPNGSGTSPASALVSGTFALLRAQFPHESARQLVTRALWNVHNGLGGKIFAKRIDDRLGYGEILPYYALTENPPAHAANPIYDRIDRYLASVGGKASSSGGTASSGSSLKPSATSSTPAAASGSPSSGGISPALIGGGVAVLVVLVLGVAVLVRRQTVGRPPLS